MRMMTSIVALGLLSSSAFAQNSLPPRKHLFIHRTEHAARVSCPNDRVVWANTTSRRLYRPGNLHYGHTPGGFVCESVARANGYKGPTAQG